jgi:2-keto-4-pentenoate hydratase
VLGPAASLEAARDLGREWPILHAGGRAPDPPRADLVPSDLGELLAFVAGYLAGFRETLEPGDVVLSGSYTPKAAQIGEGDEVVAEFGPLGAVSVRVAI